MEREKFLLEQVLLYRLELKHWVYLKLHSAKISLGFGK